MFAMGCEPRHAKEFSNIVDAEGRNQNCRRNHPRPRTALHAQARPTKYTRTQVYHVTSEAEFDEIIKLDNVVIDFYADWCGPCKRLAPLLDQLAQEFSHILFFKVNSDNFNQLSSKFNIRGIPTLLLFKNGTKVAQMVGSQSKQDYVAAFTKEFGK